MKNTVKNIRKTILKEVVTIQVGYQARNRIVADQQGSHYLIQSKDFDSNNQLQLSDVVRFFPERNPEYYTVIKNNILFQARGNENFAYFVGQEIQDTLAAGTFYIIKVHDATVLPAYIAWWLNQKEAQNYFRLHTGASTVSFVSKKVLEHAAISIPPLEIQQKILAITGLWKQEKSLHEKLIAKKSRLVTSLCMHYITNKDR